MCKEVTAFLETIETISAGEARKVLEEHLRDNPDIFTELKGVSIARAVQQAILEKREHRAALLPATDTEPAAWGITKGFLRYFGVETIEQLGEATFVGGNKLSVDITPVNNLHEMTDVERKFAPFTFSFPSVRVDFQPTASEIA